VGRSKKVHLWFLVLLARDWDKSNLQGNWKRGNGPKPLWEESTEFGNKKRKIRRGKKRISTDAKGKHSILFGRKIGGGKRDWEKKFIGNEKKERMSLAQLPCPRS